MTEPNQMWSAPSPASLIEPRKTSWLLIIAVGLLVGAAAAIAYAWISAAIENEILFLIIGVGLLVGLAITATAKVSNVGTGLLSLGITAASLSLAIYLLAGGGVPDAFEYFGDYGLEDAFDAYFSDALGYIWVLASLGAAYYCGSGAMKNNSAAKSQVQTPAGPQVMPQITPQITPPDPSSQPNPPSGPDPSSQPPLRTF